MESWASTWSVLWLKLICLKIQPIRKRDNFRNIHVASY